MNPKEAEQQLTRANNATAQALSEQKHTETQQTKDFSEVRNQIAKARQALRYAEEELEQ